MNITEFKQANPQYQNVSDTKLAFLLHHKHYQNVPIKDFLSQVGVDPVQAQIDAGRDESLWGYWRDQVSRKLDGETDQQQRERLYGADLRAKPDSVAEGTARAGLQGATMGLSDEAVAVGAAALDPFVKGSGGSFSDRYNAYLGNERDKMDSFRETNPKTALGAEIGGAVVTGGIAAKAGLSAMKNAKTLPALMKGGAVEGALYGGISGMGYAEDGVKNRLTGARNGAASGSVMGLGAPILLSGGSALGRLVKEKVASYIGSPAKQATARLAQAMRQAGMTPDEIAAKLDDLGPEGMLVDTLGEPGTALARSASNLNPAARETLENASTSRMAGQPDRLTDALLNASGLDQAKTLQELQEAARASARPAISEAYDNARSLGYDIDLKAFDDVMQSGIAAKAYSDGQRLAKDRMIAEASRTGNVSDDVMKNGPSNFDILDETKKSLDARAAPALGQQQTNEQAIAGQLSKTIRNRIDEYIPEYGGARDLARQLHRQQDAIALGAEGAKPRVAADFARQAQSIDPTHQPSLAQGYAAAKIDQINNRRTTPGVVDALFGPRRQQEALTSALGPKSTNVRKQIATERTFGRTDRALKGNSSTTRQLIEVGTLGAGAGYGIGGDPMSAGGGALASLLARRVGAKGMRALTAKRDARVSPMIADALIGREIPEGMLKQVERNPALQKLLIRALAQQTGGRIGAATTEQ